MTTRTLSHLDLLESESIQIMREVAAEFERPVLLFSGGKDSICMLRVAEKAFRPARFPFPLMHIDTGHNFPELIEFRDRRAEELGERLIVRTVEDALAKGIARQTPGETSRNRLQTPTLLAALEEFKFDCALGGARRDEEKARAKERVFSFRDAFGQWDPKTSAPNYGACTTDASIRASICVSSRSATGPSSTSGNISSVKTSICPPSTSATNAKWSGAMVNGFR